MGQIYASPGPEPDTITIHLPGKPPTHIPVAVAFALRYDLSKSLPVVPNDRTWWRVLVGRCVKCCGIDRSNCKCATYQKSKWVSLSPEGREWSRNYRVEWTRRERAAAVLAGQCTRCFKRKPTPPYKACEICRKKDSAYKNRKKKERQSENS